MLDGEGIIQTLKLLLPMVGISHQAILLIMVVMNGTVSRDTASLKKLTTDDI